MVGPTWALTTLEGEPVLAGTFVTAQFGEDGSVGGSAGCNTYSASYELDGNKLSIGPAMSTMMACEPQVTAQEGAYLAMLDSVASYKVEGENLSLYDADKAEVATYEVVDQSLDGTSWLVISYNTGTEAVRSVILDTEITANFGEDGQITGNTSCNDYFGPYETEGDTISIGPLGTTRKMCAEPEGVMEQESAYLAALQTATMYRIEGQRMRMLTAEGATAVTFDRTSGQ